MVRSCGVPVLRVDMVQHERLVPCDFSSDIKHRSFCVAGLHSTVVAHLTADLWLSYITFVEIDHYIISMVMIFIQLIQED